MLSVLTLALAITGQHPNPHPSGGHAGGHAAGGHTAGVHLGGAGGHPGGPHAAAMEHQVMQDIAQHEAYIQQQRHLQHQQHMAAINHDLPRVEAHLKEMRFDHKHWDELRHHHSRLGVETFWRLARRHREIDKLLAALREEKGNLREDSTAARLARLKARRETWDILAESRFFAFLKERGFEHRNWENLRFYYERLGAERFWRLARDRQEFEPFKLALSAELRRKLLEGLDEQPAKPIRNEPIARAKTVSSGMIEISPSKYKVGKTTDSSSVAP
jgi:hypothetical protein